MAHNLIITNNIIIPEHELEISTSRGGGPGGQHINKTNTKISIRWNVKNSQALNEAQKELVLQKLTSRITANGDLIIHSSSSRSQQQNKDMARARLAQEIRRALHIPKKRVKTKTSKEAQEKRLQEKAKRSFIKKMRIKIDE